MTTDAATPMTPAEVSALYNVDPKTVTRWAKEGKIPSFKTPGGHLRMNRAAIVAMYERAQVVA